MMDSAWRTQKEILDQENVPRVESEPDGSDGWWPQGDLDIITPTARQWRTYARQLNFN